MRKIFAIILALMLIASMAIPAAAVTPKLKVPDVPQISNIKLEVKLDEKVYENAVEKWFAEHPLKFDFSKIKLPDWFG